MGSSGHCWGPDTSGHYWAGGITRLAGTTGYWASLTCTTSHYRAADTTVQWAASTSGHRTEHRGALMGTTGPWASPGISGHRQASVGTSGQQAPVDTGHHQIPVGTGHPYWAVRSSGHHLALLLSTGDPCRALDTKHDQASRSRWF